MLFFLWFNGVIFGKWRGINWCNFLVNYKNHWLGVKWGRGSDLYYQKILQKGHVMRVSTTTCYIFVSALLGNTTSNVQSFAVAGCVALPFERFWGMHRKVKVIPSLSDDVRSYLSHRSFSMCPSLRIFDLEVLPCFFGSKVTRNMIHPGRLTWKLRMHPWKGKSSSKPSFQDSSSMLIFWGVKL